MKKIVVTEFLSLDGVMEAPDKWQMGYVNEEMGKDILDELVKSDALLFGRTTFDGMAAAWPSRKDAAADKFNNLPKFVVSTTLNKTDWNKSTIIKSNVTEELKKLKHQTGTQILVWGSLKLVQMMMEYNLIDEYRLYIHPCLLGKGKR